MTVIIRLCVKNPVPNGRDLQHEHFIVSSFLIPASINNLYANAGFGNLDAWMK